MAEPRRGKGGRSNRGRSDDSSTGGGGGGPPRKPRTQNSRGGSALRRRLSASDGDSNDDYSSANEKGGSGPKNRNQNASGGAKTGQRRNRASSQGDSDTASRHDVQLYRPPTQPRAMRTTSTGNSHAEPAALPHSTKTWTGSAPAGDSSWEERYAILKKNRDAERLQAYANGTLQDPNVPRRLEDAITIVGTCQDMCAEFERVQRVVQNDVMAVEADPERSTALKPYPVEALMVKKFRRPAAGLEEQLPSDIRPPAVLKKTCDYLFNILIKKWPLEKVHPFIWDRSRAIRNDFSIQQLTAIPDVRIAIDCYERIARFHLLTLHQLGVYPVPEDYDAQQDFEQLVKTLISLKEYYEQVSDRYTSPNAAEFEAYFIILGFQATANVRHAEIARDVRVQHAYKLAKAAEKAADPMAIFAEEMPPRKNWARFWGVLRHRGTPYLLACAAETQFNRIRRTMLEGFWKATRGGSKDVKSWALSQFCMYLGFDTEDELRAFCEYYGVPVSDSPDGISYIDFVALTNKGGFANVKPMAHQFRSNKHVEPKRQGRSFTAIINGLSVEEAERTGEIVQNDTSQQMNGSNGKEESLFVSGDTDAEEETAPKQMAPTNLSPFATPFQPSRGNPPNGTNFFGKPTTSQPPNQSSSFQTSNPFAGPSSTSPFSAQNPANQSTDKPNEFVGFSMQNAQSTQANPFGGVGNGFTQSTSNANMSNFRTPGATQNKQAGFSPQPSSAPGSNTPNASAPNPFASLVGGKPQNQTWSPEHGIKFAPTSSTSSMPSLGKFSPKPTSYEQLAQSQPPTSTQSSAEKGTEATASGSLFSRVAPGGSQPSAPAATAPSLFSFASNQQPSPLLTAAPVSTAPALFQGTTNTTGAVGTSAPASTPSLFQTQTTPSAPPVAQPSAAEVEAQRRKEAEAELQRKKEEARLEFQRKKEEAQREVEREAERQQRVAARKDQALEDIARQLVTNPDNGMLAQFIAFEASKAIPELIAQVKEEKAVTIADDFYRRSLLRRGLRVMYERMWKNLALKRGQRLRQRQHELRKKRESGQLEAEARQAAEARMSQDVEGFQPAIRAHENNGTVSDRSASEETDISSILLPRKFNGLRNGESAAMPPPSRPWRHARRNISRTSSLNGEQPRLPCVRAAPKKEPGLLEKCLAGDAAWSTGGVVNTTETSYFKLQAMGLDPDTLQRKSDRKRSRTLDDDGETSDRKLSPPDRKRVDDSEKDDRKVDGFRRSGSASLRIPGPPAVRAKDIDSSESKTDALLSRWKAFKESQNARSRGASVSGFSASGSPASPEDGNAPLASLANGRKRTAPVDGEKEQEPPRLRRRRPSQIDLGRSLADARELHAIFDESEAIYRELAETLQKQKREQEQEAARLRRSFGSSNGSGGRTSASTTRVPPQYNNVLGLKEPPAFALRESRFLPREHYGVAGQELRRSLRAANGGGGNHTTGPGFASSFNSSFGANVPGGNGSGFGSGSGSGSFGAQPAVGADFLASSPIAEPVVPAGGGGSSFEDAIEL